NVREMRGSARLASSGRSIASVAAHTMACIDSSVRAPCMHRGYDDRRTRRREYDVRRLRRAASRAYRRGEDGGTTMGNGWIKASSRRVLAVAMGCQGTGPATESEEVTAQARAAVSDGSPTAADLRAALANPTCSYGVARWGAFDQAGQSNTQTPDKMLE